MPNIDETFDFPFDPKKITSDDPGVRLEYERTRVKSFRKMYEEVANGINNSFEFDLKQQGDFADSTLGMPVFSLPKLGMFLIIVSGVEDDMPMKMVAAMKQTVGTAATFTTIASKAGVGATWNTLNVLIQSTGDEIGISHDGTGGETGRATVTLFGPYKPEDSGSPS